MRVEKWQRYGMHWELVEQASASTGSWLYPLSCHFCDRVLEAYADFCDVCRKELTADPTLYCRRCGASCGKYERVEDGCNNCHRRRFCFSSVLRMGPYQGKLREAVLHMKSSAGEGLAEMLGKLWAVTLLPQLQELPIDAVVPVPLHWIRRWQRRYNQAATLAQCLSDQLGRPFRPRWLRRVRHTPFQTEQPALERWANVRNAFYAPRRRDLQGKAILLVDDVMTTGSTCDDASRALRAAGAAAVHVAVLAHSTL